MSTGVCYESNAICPQIPNLDYRGSAISVNPLVPVSFRARGTSTFLRLPRPWRGVSYRPLSTDALRRSQSTAPVQEVREPEIVLAHGIARVGGRLSHPSVKAPSGPSRAARLRAQTKQGMRQHDDASHIACSCALSFTC
jgi:hypothetical protein